MISYETIAGGALIAGLAITASTHLLHKPIEVHSLEFRDGVIFQDRTVRTKNDAPFFFAHWEASFVNSDTGDVACNGEGDWPYEPGRKTAEIPYLEWVGYPDCTLPPGTYVPIAAWLWGDDQEVHRGKPFTIE